MRPCLIYGQVHKPAATRVSAEWLHHSVTFQQDRPLAEVHACKVELRRTRSCEHTFVCRLSIPSEQVTRTIVSATAGSDAVDISAYLQTATSQRN